MRTEAELIHRIIAHMPADTPAAVQQDAALLLEAAFQVAYDPSVSSPAVRAHLDAVATGFGCWIGDVQTAFDAAKEEFPGAPDYALWSDMRGALFMASAWLEDLHRAQNWKPTAKPFPAPVPSI